MMKKLSIATVALTVVLAAGCKQKSSTESYSQSTPQSQPAASAQAESMTPEQLGELGAQIKKHPSEANKILSEHGIDQPSFEKQIRKVASDPAASRRYRDAYKKAV